MVLIINPEQQALEFSVLLNTVNIEHTIFPTLQIQALSPSCSGHYDIVVFISKNAVHCGVKYLSKLSNYQLLAIGNVTAKTLAEYHFKADFYPRKNPSSDTLLAIPEVAAITYKKILIIRGVGGVETLKEAFVKNHNAVDYLEVYNRVLNTNITCYQQNLDRFLTSDQQIIVITSNDNLKFLLQLSDKISKNTKLVVVSDRIKKYAIELGFNRIIITSDISHYSIIRGLQKWLN